MASPKSFEQQYPAIDRFIEEFGCIEIGENDMISAFVRAYSEGGTVYEGKDTYPSMDEAFKDLDRGIQAFFDENGM
jgi:hypothetical protein